MKRITYVVMLVFITLIIISANVYAAAVSRNSNLSSGSLSIVSNNNDKPTVSIEKDTSDDDTPSDDGIDLITTSSNLASDQRVIGNSTSLTADRVSNSTSPRVQILSISPNPSSVNQTIRFSAWGSNPKENSTICVWNFGDGNIEKYVAKGSPFYFNTTHIYNDLGSYNASFYIIVNEKMYIDFETVDILVIFSPIDAGGPYLGKVNDIILFDGSTDEVDDVVSYEWDFGDEKTSDKLASIHSYSDYGFYTANFKVIDELGNIYTDTADVIIARISIAIHPSSPVVNENVVFGAEVLGFIPTKFEWQFGDGSKGNGQCSTHIYNSSGTYYGKLRVYGYNSRSIYTNFIVTVSENTYIDNEEPVSIFSISPSDGDTSTIFEFDASDSYDPDGDIISYEWYLGDGNMIVTRGATCNYIYGVSGFYYVTCVVGDSYGKYGYLSKRITVTDSNRDQPLQAQSSSDRYDSNQYSKDVSTINGQDGLMFFSGEMKEITSSDSSTDQLAMKKCDLKIDVDKIPIIPIFNGKITLYATIEDIFGIYDEEYVEVELKSDIPGYENINHYAKKDLNSEYYSVNINIVWPEKVAPYIITITAKPYGDYSESNWENNRWSEIINGGTSDSSNFSKTISSGSISL